MRGLLRIILTLALINCLDAIRLSVQPNITQAQLGQTNIAKCFDYTSTLFDVDT